MLSIANILVPVVFTARCAWAARYAARLAREFESQLTFLHVGQKNDTNALESFVSKATGTGGHKLAVLDGDPAGQIIEFANESKADLIVMPTYHGRYRTFLIGSVTAKVLHDVECAVLTGVHRYDGSPTIPGVFRNVVCALDAAPGCVPLFHWARELTSAVGAHLRLVHAISAVDETSENCGEIEVRRYLLAEARKQFSAQFASESEQPAVELHGGEIARVIREAALADHADLVIIGRGHADRALGRLRTHTYSIIRNSPCPVISV
jgi:nucleotide-binding universal stress UspA family protein